MVSFLSLLAAMPLLALSMAQTKIAFTAIPAVVVAGESYNITWGGGDGTPVTITLRQGDPNNLETVGTLKDGASGYWWLWQVSEDLPTASNYALQITQGQSDINYSGLFALVGGTGSSSISYSGLTTKTANSTITRTGTPIITSSLVPASGTGSPMPRNTTFSTPTLSHSGGATFGATGASSATASATSTPNSNSGVAQVGSSAALIMGIVAAVMCLH